MKRLISLILALTLVWGLIPGALAASAPVTSSNIDDHWYVNAQRWATPIYSNLAWEDGKYIRAEAIDGSLVVETYDENYNFLSGKAIALELPIFGGVRMDTDYNFVVVGQENLEENDETEVFRIIRYTKDWVKVDHASLFGANTYIPFDAGSLRFDRSGDILYIRTAHEMYASDDGLHHQANVMIALRISDMTVTDQLTKVWNSGYGYVSHSFNQFVRVDGDTLLAVDHGDFYPRSVALFKYSAKAGSETFYSRTTMVNVLPIVSSTYHYNDTGVSVGGFEFSDTDYLVAGSSYDQKTEADLMEVHRNIFVTATPKDDFTDEGTVLHWITNYTASDNVSVSPPHLLKVSADRFFLTWTENDVVKYCFLDGRGQLDGEIQTFEGDLSDCVPILVGNYAVWYVTDRSAPVFHRVEVISCEHSYTAAVTAPTCTESGFTTYTCTRCGHSYTADETAALGHDWSSWQTTQAPTCTENGTEQRACTRCGLTESRTLAPAGHSYDAVVTPPTCAERGYTTHTCTGCGHSYVDSYVPMLEHNWGEWYVELEPTCTAGGTQRRDCRDCGAHETAPLDPIAHSYQETVTQPTCTEQGYTTHTCTGCGHSYVDSYVAALGHAWDAGVVITEPTEEENGLRRHTCQRCSVTEDRVIPALGHTHEYVNTIVAPTCTEQGYTIHTCTCGDRYVDSYTAALGHDHQAVVTAPTCTEPGFTTHTCSRCADSFTDTPTEALGHDWLGLDCRRCDAHRENPFEDTDPLAFYFDSVLWAVEEGITSGTSATTFSPNAPCQRAQVVTFLWRAAGMPEPGNPHNPFVDVKQTDFFYKAVLWAVETGITNGLDATHFGPNASCNRAQVVTFLWRAQGCPASNAANRFIDVPAGAWYAAPINWAVENGITNGISATEFGVNHVCNRAQIVTFLYRTFA